MYGCNCACAHAHTHTHIYIYIYIYIYKQLHKARYNLWTGINEAKKTAAICGPSYAGTLL
jgi:hypothetical protein